LFRFVAHAVTRHNSIAAMTATEMMIMTAATKKKTNCTLAQMSISRMRSGLPQWGQEYASLLTVAPQAGHGIKRGFKPSSLMPSF
jgi:hypothetical protein